MKQIGKFRTILGVILVTILAGSNFVSCSTHIKPETRSLQGKGVWIWQLWNLPVVDESDGTIELSWDNDKGVAEIHKVLDFESLSSRLQDAGVDWVAIKLSDSNSFWLRDGALISRWLTKQGMTFDSFLSGLRSSGIKVLGWCFAYGESKWDADLSEVECARRIIDSGVDGLIVNAEIHLEFISNPVAYMHDYFRSLNTDILMGYTTFAEVIKHLRFPYHTFAQYCDVFMPQSYWVDRRDNYTQHGFISPEIEIERFAGKLNLLGRVGMRFTKQGFDSGNISYKHIIPIGSVESERCKLEDKSGRGVHIEADRILDFWQSSKEFFPSGFSLWSADWMDSNDWDVFTGIQVIEGDN